MGEEKKKMEEAEERVESPSKVPRLDLPADDVAEAGPGCSAAEPPESSKSTSTGCVMEVTRGIAGTKVCEENTVPMESMGRFVDSEYLKKVLSEITVPMESRRTGDDSEETSENPRKSSHLDLLSAVANAAGCSAVLPLESSVSTLTGKVTEVTNDSIDNGVCEHLFMTPEDLESILQESGAVPRCDHYLCTTETDGVSKEGASMMVCSDCYYHFCIGGASRENPQGHARWHANLYHHWVALWYGEPYSGHCFQCERILRLDPNIWKFEGVTVAGNGKDEWRTMVRHDEWQSVKVTGNSYVTMADNGKDEWRMVVRHDEWRTVKVTGNGYVINGLPNLGNTCYMNALVQCLLALGKLRTMILGPDAPFGTLGVRLKDFFVATSSAARGTLSPQNLLGNIQKLFPKFTPYLMHDSHELLRSFCNTLDREAQELNRHSIVGSIFRGQLFDIISCNRCSNTSVTHSTFDDLAVPLPSKGPSARSAASPPMAKKCRSATPRKLRRNLFPTIDESNEETVQVIAEGDDSQVPVFQSGDVAMEKPPKPLEVDSTEVKQMWQGKDVVHCSLQETQKNVVPGEIIKVPVKAADFIPNLFDDNFEGVGGSTADSTHAVEVTTKDKGKADSSDIVHEEAHHMKSIGSIEDCLSLLLGKHTIDWRCDNCSKVAELPSTNTIKDGEQKMASTNVIATAAGDQPEQSGMKTGQNEQSSDLNSLTVECTSNRQPHDSVVHHQVSLSADRITKGITPGVSYGPKYPASGSTSDQIPGCHEVVQEAVPSHLPIDKQATLLSAQDSQDARMQNQVSCKQVKLDDHGAHQVEINQNEQKDWNALPTQTHSISKLPPVLTIQIKRYSSGLSKLEGHVSFKEVLDVGPFMDPSCEDKDNSRYRLAGIVEHHGPNLSVGHYVAYVRGGPKPQSSGSSSSWFRASDANIREVSVEEVLGCEAYLLFYERMEDQDPAIDEKSNIEKGRRRVRFADLPRIHPV